MVVNAEELETYDLDSEWLIKSLSLDRVVLPRGLQPNYLEIAVSNENGCDFDLDAIETLGEALKRKKR